MAWAYWSKKVNNGNPDFVFTVNTNNTSTGSSTSTQFKLPLNSAGIYNFVVDWGDSTTDTITVWNDAATTHTYSVAGIYTITISGVCRSWRFNNTGDRLKILEIQNWGTLEQSGSGAGWFYGCTNLNVTATDIFTIVGSTSMVQAFMLCSNLVWNSSVNNLDVSTVTNFTNTFDQCPLFNQSINNWNTSSGTIFTSMIRLSTAFNQPINNLKLTGICESMLRSTSFNQDITTLDPSDVTSFSRFLEGTPFDSTNYSNMLNSWTNVLLKTGVPFHAGTAKYNAGSVAARALLTRANSTVTVTNAANNGSGLIRITTGSAHGRTTGDKIFISGVTGTTEANGGWIVTVIDATNVDLQSSTFTNTYVSGGTFRIGYGWTITDGGAL